MGATEDDPAARAAGARRFALTLGRVLELAHLAGHAAWALRAAADPRPAAAARRLARNGIDLITAPHSPDDAILLAR